MQPSGGQVQADWTVEMEEAMGLNEKQGSVCQRVRQ